MGASKFKMKYDKSNPAFLDLFSPDDEDKFSYVNLVYDLALVWCKLPIQEKKKEFGGVSVLHLVLR